MISLSIGVDGAGVCSLGCSSMDIASERASNAATCPMPSIRDGTASNQALRVEISVVHGLQF